MQSGWFVCHSICVQENCKSNQPILLKLRVVICPTSWKNWLTVDADPVPDTDSRSLFHFPYHCGIEYLRRFIDISHTVLTTLSKMTDVENVMYPQHFVSNVEDTWIRIRSGLIQKSVFEFCVTMPAKTFTSSPGVQFTKNL